jgi:NUDIX domain
MHRRPLRELLADYATVYPAEDAIVTRFREFVDTHEDCLARTCVPGHVTASAWILSPDHQSCLLTLHRKLGKWLQLGGHVDGEPEVWRAALAEAQEESGMMRFQVAERPLDLDIHPIPAHGGEPAHLHLDVRFLMCAEPGQSVIRSAESLDLDWFPVAALSSVTSEVSVLRLQDKARSRLAATGGHLGQGRS